MKQTLNMRQQLSINLRYCYTSRRATQNMSAASSSPTIGKPTWRMAISSHCLSTLPTKMSAFSIYMRKIPYYGDSKCMFEDLLPCYCYATKANSRTIRSRVSQPARGCQFGIFEAKFVILGFFSTRLAFFIFEKRPNEIWLFLAFLAS